MAGATGTGNARRTSQRTRASAIGDAWIGRTYLDVIAALLVAGIHMAVALLCRHGDVLSWPSTEGRVATYAAGAGVMALIAGFTGTAIAQYASSTGSIVNMLRQEYGHIIRRNCLDIMGWLLASAILCIIAMAVDTKRGTSSWAS